MTIKVDKVEKKFSSFTDSYKNYILYDKDKSEYNLINYCGNYKFYFSYKI